MEVIINYKITPLNKQKPHKCIMHMHYEYTLHMNHAQSHTHTVHSVTEFNNFGITVNTFPIHIDFYRLRFVVNRA